MSEAVQQAVAVLRAGGLLLYPTDTVWGVGCDATDAAAVARVFALKRRDDRKSLIVLASDIAMLRRYVGPLSASVVHVLETARTPLTIVYPQAQRLAANVPATDGSVAIRLVRHFFCEQLLRAFGRPLVSSSANVSGQPAPADFAAVADEMKRGCDFIVPPACEGAPTRRPSSIVKIGEHEELIIIRP
ncbi:MAG: threonylcarbamoyl-AMP synthase [Prevotellaceae bacterium]|jgi:L-threonylcarbamoyladenylate synthase|nr:threonylcarbamoyl-AMP synthase [Prevotellaceae bacterium]